MFILRQPGYFDALMAQINPSSGNSPSSSSTLTGAVLKSLRNRAVSIFGSYYDTYLAPYVPSVVTGLANLDLIPLLMTLLALYISIKLLDYARRMVMYWIRLAFSLVFYLSIGLGAWYIYAAGPEKAMNDLGWFVGVVGGLVQGWITAADQGQRQGSRDYRYGYGAGAGAGSGSRGAQVPIGGRRVGRNGW